MKRTEGIWTVSPPMGPGNWAVLSEGVTAYGNFYVAEIPNGNHAEAEGNCRLLAAAPELLEAVKAMESAWMGNTGKDQSVAMDQAAILARNAIAKAEGKERKQVKAGNEFLHGWARPSN